MSKLNKFLCLAAVGLFMVGLSSCGDDDNYQPGPETPSTSVAAYFSSANEANLILTPDEYNASKNIVLTVERKSTEAAVSIPVVVDAASEGLDIPATVDFAAGEATSTLTISCPNLTAATTYSYQLHLDEAYVDPYTKLDGSSVFKGSILIARWIKVVDGGYYLYENNRFPSGDCNIYQLEGQNKFYFENFMGSGIDLGFYIAAEDSETGEFTASAFNASDRTTWKGVPVPTDHSLADPTGGSYWWLMSNVENEDYAGWSIEGSSVGIDYISYYQESPVTDSYAYIDMSGSSSSYSAFFTPYIYLSDGSETGYTYIFFYWDSSNIPATE